MAVSSLRCDRRWPAVALLAVVLTLAAALVPAAAQSSAPAAQKAGIPPMGAIIGPDTFLHIFGGMMAGMFAASAASALDSRATIQRYPLFLPAVGFSAAFTAGIAKETLDSTGFGDPQWSDFVHTVIGGLLVAGVIAAVELAPTSGGVSSQSSVYALWGVEFAVPVGAAFANEIHLYLVKRRLKK